MEYQFEKEVIQKDLRRLINQIWKLLPMRENNEDWQKQIEIVLVELRGLHKMFGDQLNFLIIVSSLEGLRETDDFATYRSTIFNVLSLMTEAINVRES